MKRFHVHAHAQDLQASYARWMLGEPRLDFALSGPRGVAREHVHALADVPVFRQLAPAAGQGPAATACCVPRGKPVGVPVRDTSGCC